MIKTQVVEEVSSEVNQQTVVEVEQSVMPSQADAGAAYWDALLSNFSSLPSKMFFSNLSAPVLISPEKIVIGFTKDVFVKQSKDAGRMTPLKNAVEALFGSDNIPIEIRLISETEANEIKNGVKKKSNIAQPVKNISEVKPTVAQAQQSPNAQTNNESDDEYYEQQLAKAQSTKQPQVKQHSDQAKMILDLFNGKYMD